MRYLRRQQGFTLLELTLVLAISALLVVTVLAGQSVLQRSTAFTASIDAVRSQLKAIQSEAGNTLGTRSATNAAGSGMSSQLVFGKLVVLDNSDPEKNTMKTWTLVSDSGGTALRKCNEKDILIQQTVEFNGSTQGAGPLQNKQAIIFTNNPDKTYGVSNFTETSIEPGASTIVCDAPAVASAPVTLPTSLVCGRTAAHPEGTLCPAAPLPPRPAVACDADAAYQCGLYGLYYDGDSADPTAKILTSKYIEAIGPDMGPAPHMSSSAPAWTSTLAGRIKSPAVKTSVNWTGEIKIDDNDQHTFCFESDDGSHAVINGRELTNNYGSSDQAAQPCTIVQVSLPGWYSVSIDYAHHSAVDMTDAHAFLYELLPGNVKQQVTKDKLRTSSANREMPLEHYIAGLYGEYYDSTVIGTNRIATHTDPLIGDGGGSFSYIGSSVDQNGAFTPEIRQFTANPDASAKAIKWTGQMLIDDTTPRKYCFDVDDNATMKIDGVTMVANGAGLTCSAFVGYPAGWHDIEINYINGCCSGSLGEYAFIRLRAQINGGASTEIPASHYRRPMAWAATGSEGSCSPSSYGDYCKVVGTALRNQSSSSGTCTSGNNGAGTMTYTKTGLIPGSNYIMDLTYHNDPKDGLPAPSNYSYHICVTVNGTLIANSQNLPISEPSTSVRTTTFNGIVVPANGKVTVVFDWLNDAWNGAPSYLGGYDANFAIDRVDLFRNSPIASIDTPAKTVATADTNSLVKKLLGHIFTTTHAAVICDTNILNPTNYNADCFGATPLTTLNLLVPGEADRGFIDITSNDGGIRRRITK